MRDRTERTRRRAILTEPKAPIPQILDAMHQELVRIYDAYATSFDESDAPGQRMAIGRAMCLVVDAFGALGMDHTIVEPFTRVLRALVDVERDVPDALFQVRKSAPGGRKDAGRRAQDGYLAAIAELFWRGRGALGLGSLNQVMVLAAREINEANCYRMISGAELLKLRERVRQDTDSKSPERAAFDEMTKGDIVKEFPLQAARVYLRLDPPRH